MLKSDCDKNKAPRQMPRSLFLLGEVLFVGDNKSDKSRSMDKKGVGLGLYLVKTILRAHGGDITAESEEGKYCRFIMHIPTYIEK